jgi:uncharacterized protein with HEPN domain
MSGLRQPLGLNEYLSHIFEAISRIEKYTESLTYEDFATSTREQDAVIRNLEVVGEARRNIEKR